MGMGDISSECKGESGRNIDTTGYPHVKSISGWFLTRIGGMIRRPVG